MNKDPVKCDRCHSSLNGGWSERWRVPKGKTAAVRVEAVCFDCDETESVYEFNKDKILTSRITINAAIKGTREQYGGAPHRYSALYKLVNASYEKVRLEVKRFEQAVWFAGLQKQVQDATNRGFKMTFGDTIAMVYSLAARTQITIESGDKQVTVITAEDETDPVMGINGIRATEKDAIHLLASAAKAYKEGFKFLPDDKVGLGF